MAVAPISPMVAVVTERIRDPRASGSRKRQMICHEEAPIDWAASMIPEGTSRREFSTRRAM